MSPRLRWSERGCPVSRFDSYARAEAARRKTYEAAFDSDEAKAWRESLSAADREHAESRGLLRPMPEHDAGSRSLDVLHDKMQPQETRHYDDHLIAAPLRRRLTRERIEVLATLGMQDLEELQAFLQQDGNPRLRGACLSYLLNRGNATIEDFAKQLNMSKQAFHYHVRRIEKQLGLPPMGNQRKQKSRAVYRMSNRRR